MKLFVVALLSLSSLFAWLTVERLRSYETEFALWQDAVAHQPGDAFAHNNLGMAFASQGRMTEAAESFEQAIRLQPEFAQAHCNLGTALTELRQFERALQECLTAVRLDGNVARYHNNLGNVLNKLGRRQEAIAQYDMALQIDPRHPEARRNKEIVERRLKQ